MHKNRQNGSDLSPEECIHFRDRLRSARAATYADSEDTHEVLIAIEALGARIDGQGTGLWDYRRALTNLCHDHAQNEDDRRRSQLEFEELFELVRMARNDAVHQGAFARHFATNATKLAVMLEDTLMTNLNEARHFMVSNPVCTSPVESIAYIRQQMLANSFSYLPLRMEHEGADRWWLVSDSAIVRLLRATPSERRKRLNLTLRAACAIPDPLPLLRADSILPNTAVLALAEADRREPWLVVDGSNEARLLGIITTFDLL